MRLLVTADLHFNHPRSRPLAEGLIAEMNAAGGDVLLIVGDTAPAGAADALEQCLSLFRFRGTKLFVSGNHELWVSAATPAGGASAVAFRDELPRRVRALGWHWLEDDPWTDPAAGVGIVGSVGWYDYTFAEPSLRIPRRFYQAKLSPGAAARLGGHGELLRGDEPDEAMRVVARWNDGRFVSLGESDEAFLAGRIASLEAQLRRLASLPAVVAAVHHVPFAELLPPRHGAQWDFARAYLGSPAMGRMLRQFPSVRHVLCGHSHTPAEARIGSIEAINIGSGYRQKAYRVLDVKA